MSFFIYIYDDILNQVSCMQFAYLGRTISPEWAHLVGICFCSLRKLIIIFILICTDVSCNVKFIIIVREQFVKKIWNSIKSNDYIP